MVTKSDQMHVKDDDLSRNCLLYLSLGFCPLCIGISVSRFSLPLDVSIHSFQPGDTVYVQNWKDELLVGKKMFSSNAGDAAYRLQWETEGRQHLSVLASFVWQHLPDFCNFGAALVLSENASGYI